MSIWIALSGIIKYLMKAWPLDISLAKTISVSSSSAFRPACPSLLFVKHNLNSLIFRQTSWYGGWCHCLDNSYISWIINIGYRLPTCTHDFLRKTVYYTEHAHQLHLVSFTKMYTRNTWLNFQVTPPPPYNWVKAIAP